jgi:predicted RNA binding protein YcfA (HicA-like mRNA interferase family)
VARLPVVSGKDLIKYFQKKGFYVSRIRGSHHILKSDNIPTMLIVIPFHHEIDPGTLKNILEDANIERDVFIREWSG